MAQLNGHSLSVLQPAEEAMAVIADSLRRIRFGSIAVTVHEGRVVQLDITEKRRIAR